MKEHHFILIVQESNYPQMGALYLASALLRVGIITHVIGSSASARELDELIKSVDPIAVGCSVMTAPEILDFVRHSVHIQNTYNNRGRTRIPVIWGGMHSTIVWEQTMKEQYIDVVVMGEAEITLPCLLLELLRTGRLPSRKLVSAETPAALDNFRPLWDVDVSKFLFPESHSVHARVQFKKEHVFYYLLTSRGCTYKCNFCWEVARTATLREEERARAEHIDLTWRAHSVSWIEREIEYLEQRVRKAGFTMDGIGLWDDMPFGKGTIAHTERARSIFQLMKRKRYGYLLEARANQLIKTDNVWIGSGEFREADLYRFLAETGCMQVFVGAESANQDTLNLIQKGTKVLDYYRLIEMSRDVGLPLRLSLIVGFPNETEQSVNDTLDFIECLKGESFVSVSGPKLFTPYPRTPQYVSAVQQGMSVPADTLGWAYLTRYGDYRAIYPWIRDYSESTLKRIEGFWQDVPEEKKYRPQEETILEIVRSH